MNYFIFIMVIGGVIAGIIAVFMLVEAVLGWLHFRLVKEYSIETTGRILHMEILNRLGRYTPYVRLQLEITTEAGECIITEAESFFPEHALSTLVPDTFIHIRYNPHNILQVQVIKEVQPLHQETYTWRLLVNQPAYEWTN